MERSISKAISIITLATLVLMSSPPCHADTNELLGLECSQSEKATANNGEYQVNLNTSLSLLAANAPTNNGFYTTAAGKGDNKIYGLTQCRGDLSAFDCSNCIKNASLSHGCSGSKNVTVWLRWCFIRYSNISFFGSWYSDAMATDNDTDFEDQNVVSAGLNFMNGLASTTPKQRLMFQTAVLDAGQNGKRYGMAQCTRDISSGDCGQCLGAQLVTFRTTIGNKRGWEIYGFSCSMWYHDFQFYFNYSIPGNEGAARFSPHQPVIVMIISAMAMFLLVS